jgi:hypothetical protein
MTYSGSAEELRLAARAMRHAIEAARGAAEIAGLDLLPIAEEAGARSLADWLDDRAAECEREAER